MASIDSDTKKPKPATPAASTRKRGDSTTLGADVFMRDAPHYETGNRGEVTR